MDTATTPQVGEGRLLITYGEAASALAVSPRYLRALVYQGLLPSVRLGRLRRIAMEDLTAFVEDLRNGMHARTQPTDPWRTADSDLDDLKKGSRTPVTETPASV